jgi:hypothetical protein
VSHLFDERPRFSGEAVQWLMAVREFKKLQSKFVTLVGRGL